VVEIRETRTARQPSKPVLAGATTAMRFKGFRRSEPEPSDDLMDYDLPTGWKALPPTQDRLINLRPAGEPEAACTLSFLQGSAGGLEANVNRWRKQFGAEPLSAAEVAGLPTFPLLGRDAALVEVEGTFAGMGDIEPRAGFRLLGLVISEPDGSLFLKFTGPGALVQNERENFLSLARSLHLAEGHASAGGSGAMGAPSSSVPSSVPPQVMASTVTAGGRITWSVPEGWQQEGPRPMREVSFQLGPEAECYVTRLTGDAGGLRANLDRWCTQFGRDRLGAAEFAALPKATVLGIEVPVLELEGAFTGMEGSTQEGHGLLAIACIRASDSVFVKLTGPIEVVRAQRENFMAFVSSLQEAR